MSRTIVFGLDGAAFSVLDDLIARGVMPYLGRFCREGTRAALMSTEPPLTPIAWSSLVTGRTPGHHGITGFFQYAAPDSRSLQVVTGRQLRAPTIWSIASRQGTRSISLNFAVHQPPPRIDGCIVPGWVPWRWLKRFTHPAGLVERLSREIAGFDVQRLAMDFQQERKALVGEPAGDHEAWIDLHVQRDRQWFAVLRHLMETERCGLAGIVFDGVDKLQHLLWPYLDPDAAPPAFHSFESTRRACWQYFAQLDAFLEEAVALAGPDGTVMVVSDHGFTGSRDLVFVNTWLEQRGYLTWKPDVPIVSDTCVELEPDFYKLSAFDMERTQAFALTCSSNGIHIAVRGERGDGGIPCESYEGFRERLADDLLTHCVDPATGDRLITRVSPREQVFGGPAMTLAPDLTVTLRDHGFVSVRRSAAVFAPRPQVIGTHHPEGVFIARGPGIRQSCAASPLSLIDVAPTVLYTLGLDIPADLEGRVATDIFTPEHLFANAATVGLPGDHASVAAGMPELSGEQTAEILERLRALGYVE